LRKRLPHQAPHEVIFRKQVQFLFHDCQGIRIPAGGDIEQRQRLVQSLVVGLRSTPHLANAKASEVRPGAVFSKIGVHDRYSAAEIAEYRL